MKNEFFCHFLDDPSNTNSTNSFTWNRKSSWIMWQFLSEIYQSIKRQTSHVRDLSLIKILLNQYRSGIRFSTIQNPAKKKKVLLVVMMLNLRLFKQHNMFHLNSPYRMSSVKILKVITVKKMMIYNTVVKENEEYFRNQQHH